MNTLALQLLPQQLSRLRVQANIIFTFTHLLEAVV